MYSYKAFPDISMINTSDGIISNHKLHINQIQNMYTYILPKNVYSPVTFRVHCYSIFFQNEKIFVQLDEFDEFDRITDALQPHTSIENILV